LENQVKADREETKEPHITIKKKQEVLGRQIDEKVNKKAA
jgi:hypothetical protein